MTDLIEPATECRPATAPARWRSAMGRAAVVAFLSAVAWFAHFAGWRDLGFYADDHTFAVPPMAWTSVESNRNMLGLAFSYPDPQGRPLGWFLGTQLPYVVYPVAGVFGLFAAGWLILSLNAALLYALLARRLPPPMPLVGALMFLLFPADTTRPFLCHAHILQPSLTFALVAAHLFLCRSWWARAIGYPIAGLCLLTYETALLPLLAVPLLDCSRFRSPRQGKEPRTGGTCLQGWAYYLLPFVAMIAIVAVTRSQGGEFRAQQAAGGKATVVAHVILGVVRGPLYVAHACLRRPWQQIAAACRRPAHGGLIVVAALVFGVAVRLSCRRARPTPDAVRRAVVFGTVALGLSYLLSFTHYPPSCEEGQSTSVHTAAVIGSAALAAAAVGWLTMRRSVRWAIAVAGVYFGLSFGWAIDEQAGLGVIWHERQQFWAQVLDLCPDMTNGTVILCDGQLPQPNMLMPANLWSDTTVPAQVYQFPPSFRLPPVLMAYPSTPGEDWGSSVAWTSESHLYWRTPPSGCLPQVIAEGNLILLRIDRAGRVRRASGDAWVAGRRLTLRPPPPAGTRPPYPTLPFFNVLLHGRH